MKGEGEDHGLFWPSYVAVAAQSERGRHQSVVREANAQSERDRLVCRAS